MRIRELFLNYKMISHLDALMDLLFNQIEHEFYLFNQIIDLCIRISM
jgi:hypothetical protein